MKAADDQLVSLYVRLRDERLVRTRWPEVMPSNRLGRPDILAAGWNEHRTPRHKAWSVVAREWRRKKRSSMRWLFGLRAPSVMQGRWTPVRIIAWFVGSWVVVGLALVLIDHW